MKKYLIIAGLVFFSQCFMVSAQGEAASDNVLLVTEQVVESMVYSSFTYQRAKVAFEQAKRTKNSSMWNWLLPTTGANASISTSSKDTQSNLAGEWKGSIGLSAQLEISAWVEMEILKALSDYESGKITYKQSQAKTMNSAKVAFYSLIELKNQMVVSQSKVALTQTIYNQTLSMFNSGLTDRVSMLQSQLSYYNAINDDQTLQTTYERELVLFKQLVGIGLHQDIELVGEINVVPARFNGEQMTADYLGQAYDYAKAQADLNSLKWQVIASHGALLNPYVGVGYGVNRTGYYDNAINNMLGLPKTTDAFTFEVGIKISLDSMIPWSKNGLKLWEGRDGYKLNKMAVEQSRQSAEIAISVYAAQLNLLQEKIRVVQQNVVISRESLRLIETGYRQGLKTYADLQTAIQDNQSAELGLISTKLSYYRTLADLSATIGVEIDDLVRMNQTN